MSVYTCRRCEYSSPAPWEGRCPGCLGFYRAKKVGVDSGEQKQRSTLAVAATNTTVYVPTGIEGLDYVLGGGVVAGSPIQFGGFRGAGKSTLLMQAADEMAPRRKTVYASSEQSVEALAQIGQRIGARHADQVVTLGNQGNIEATLAIIKEERAFFIIYDSLQKFTSSKSAGVMGSAAQGTAVSSAIKEDCRTRGAVAIIVNQMARSGEMRGGTDVEHDVDTIAVLAYPQPDDEEAPGDEADGIRMLIVDKNRNGPENLRSYFRMDEKGIMVHVAKKSKLIDLDSRRGKYRRD